MTWPAFAVLLFGCAYAAGLVMAISSMLALKIGDGAIAVWRWCWGRP